MPRTSLIAESDRLDPWGFGTTAADEPTAVLDVSGLEDDLDDGDLFADCPDEADQAVAGLVARLVEAPRLTAMPRSPWPAAVPPPPKPPVVARGMSRGAASLLALFVLVIFAQAFYIGVLLSGEVRASAAPTGELVLASSPAGQTVSLVPAAAAVTTRPAAPRAPTAPAAARAIPAGPASGWVRVEASFEVQLLEAGQVVGSSASDRILVPAGTHVYDLVNASLGYRATKTLRVGAGRTEALVVTTPRTAVHVNAKPWAEVLIEGRVLGETPLANLMLPIGTHQILFRHPDLGERVQPVTVRLDAPNRVTADLRSAP